VAHSAEQQTITLVLDPDDELDTLRALRALHARPLGQIVCEPASTGAAELAHHLLTSLGKTPGERKYAWQRAQALLSADQIEHILLLRAHRLTYPALRRLADAAQSSASRLWIIAAGETATQPVCQLLEQRPRTIVAIDQALATLAIPLPDDDGLPADHGDDFPLLTRG
jgi:hypothetical protein